MTFDFARADCGEEAETFRRTSDPAEARESDRKWFALHRDRAMRLRESIGGEWGALPYPYTIAVQHAPGLRERLPVCFTGEPPAILFQDHARVDQMLAPLIEQLRRTQPGTIALVAPAIAAAVDNPSSVQ